LFTEPCPPENPVRRMISTMRFVLRQ